MDMDAQRTSEERSRTHIHNKPVYVGPAHWPSVRVFANGPEDWGSISGRVIPNGT